MCCCSTCRNCIRRCSCRRRSGVCVLLKCSHMFGVVFMRVFRYRVETSGHNEPSVVIINAQGCFRARISVAHCSSSPCLPCRFWNPPPPSPMLSDDVQQLKALVMHDPVVLNIGAGVFSRNFSIKITKPREIVPSFAYFQRTCTLQHAFLL